LYVIVDEQNYIQAADMLSTPASIPSHPDENPSKTTFCFLSSK
jgi:hypothetical protein